ncbi:DEAD/DEAH box helicase [Sutcliffiella rhizosphaerae]|uniref:ComF operon protein 1 n=1 Tax=Sutcliffiella rhizosphaerae TaxID=2880967 RepID=A0ABN8AE92_9BACI|nr:DEAD/DEAH box helicase [Sutcliffiella rhizosphaerae]CAG9621428.1 ComF operon protein 1 [Sutcliffiella rhizosphaerae]
MLFHLQNNILKPSTKPDAKRISEFETIPHPTEQQKFPFNKELQYYLFGKRLLPDELPFPIEMVQEHYQTGYIIFSKGVQQSKTGYVCNRCGNKESHLFFTFACARCLKQCTYCRKCIMMGRVSECTPLLSWNGAQPEQFVNKETNLAWEGTLSKGQQLASNQVVQAINHQRSLLVWAVCGAGKTEVLFAGIHTALTNGKRVCIATPRTDVVLELSPRLKKVFPAVDIATLYGGSEDRGKNAPLTISTTHQLLRYYEAFDTLIIDEVDAFPYSLDETLEYAASQARKRTASTIYLSATPSAKMQAQVKVNKLQAVTISARYHGKMLPVPTFEWCGNWEKKLQKNKLPRNLLLWIKQHHENGRPIFLFVPKIVRLEKVTSLLQKEYGDIVAGVHAKDKERKEKVESFRKGTIRILVTTTILERGVTVENVQVGVLGAEGTIFTESALVQIAGRAGRSSTYSNGDVRFFHYGKTNEMVAAKNHIRRMNYRAKQGGFLGE